MKTEEIENEKEMVNSIFENAVIFDEITQQYRMKIKPEIEKEIQLILVEDDLIQQPYLGLKEVLISQLPPIEICIKVNEEKNEFTMSCIWISNEQAIIIIDKLKQIEIENEGNGFLYGWYLYLMDIINEFNIESISVEELEYIHNSNVFSFIGSPQHRQRALLQFILDETRKEFYQQTQANCVHCKKLKPIDNFVVFGQCSHSICKECLNGKLKYCVGLKKKLCCEVCNSEVMFFELQGNVENETLGQYSELLALLCLKDDEDIVVCTNCNTAIEIGRENKEILERVFCNNCYNYFFTEKYFIQKRELEQKQEMVKKEKEQTKKKDIEIKWKMAETKSKKGRIRFNTDELTEHLISKITSTPFVQMINKYLNESGVIIGDETRITFNMNLFTNCYLLNLIRTNLTHQVIDKMEQKGFLCWHGTNDYSAGLIMRDGFDVKRRSGQCYGSGEYFASHASTSKSYGSSLLLTYVIDSRLVSRFSFGYVVNNNQRDTFCLPIACFQFDQQKSNGFDNLINVGKEDCFYLYNDLGIPATPEIVDKVINFLLQMERNKKTKCTSYITKNRAFRNRFIWFYEKQEEMIRFSESDSETLTFLHDSDSKEFIQARLDIGDVAIDIDHMCIFINEVPIKIMFVEDDTFQTN